MTQIYQKIFMTFDGGMVWYIMCRVCLPFAPRYAIRESNSVVKIFKNFKEKKSFKPDFGAESECYL